MKDSILASVNGTPITEGNVDEMIQGMGQRGAQYNTPEGRKIVLQELVNQQLFLMDAKRNLYEADPLFKAQLARVKDDLLTNYAINKAVDNVKVSEEEIKTYYEENKAQFAGQESANADHILVDTEKKANEILGKINAGDIDFAAAAKEYSSCPSSANGGNLGDFGRGQMVPEFDQAVFSMKEGEIAGPVKTQFGYHLIRLNSKKEAAPMAFETIKEQLSGMLLQEKQKKAFESKANQLKLLYPVDMYQA